ncbi:MAG: hypothetical protein MK105_13260 [Crocinitomicaceae bacterium]|nr:hypothetical protein [Crocinitomicaceae bacterium]
MSTEGKTFDINTILFESNDDLVLVKGIINQGCMNYVSDITISMSQLNELINLLKRQNSDFDLEKIMTTEKMYENEILYIIDSTQVKNNRIILSELSNQASIKQLRA